MSAKALAELIDRLAAESRASSTGDSEAVYVTEAGKSVTISNLKTADVEQLAALCAKLDWTLETFDKEDQLQSDAPTPEYEPFRARIHKPGPPKDAAQLLTNAGFAQWLAEEHPETRWHIARLPAPIVTQSVLFAPWGHEGGFKPVPRTKSPRMLVREYGKERVVPDDIRPWLLQSDFAGPFEDAAYRVWANAASRAILRSLSDEIDADDGSFKFKGPPRLSLTAPAAEADLAALLGKEGVAALVQAGAWVFEHEREAEMRHILLASEFASSGGGQGDAASRVKQHMATALEGARIAYGVFLSEYGRETLKLLAELRKAITEETAKVTETTRQLVAAVASALAIGLGLIATRVTTSVSPTLLQGVMVVVVAYVVIVALSGAQFVLLQGQLRRDWRDRLYRFLPAAEYDKMVASPAGRAECAFWWAAGIGSVATIVLAIVVFTVDRAPAQVQPENVSENVSENEAARNLALEETEHVQTPQPRPKVETPAPRVRN